jgi:hypothetical protein
MPHRVAPGERLMVLAGRPALDLVGEQVAEDALAAGNLSRYTTLGRPVV